MVPALNAVSNDKSDILVEIDFCCPVIEKVLVDEVVFDRVTMDELSNSGSIDGVALPVRSVEILLPYGQQVSSVEVVAGESFSLGTGFFVEPMYRVVQLKPGDSEEEVMYERTGFDDLFSVVGSYVMRGYVILVVNLYPVQYDSFSGELVWYDEMTVSVGLCGTDGVPVVRDVAQDSELVLDRVENPEDIESYFGKGVSVSRDSVDYLIITNEDLRDATGTYTFQDLVASKEAKGMSAAIVTVEDIVSNPDFWVNGVWGDNTPSNPFYNCPILGSVELFNDTQAMIRNYIRYAFVELGTSYVLLGGDADYSTSDNIVPVRELYAVEDGLPLGRDLVEDDIPSDVYYACLDGNFNRDEDVHFGENETQNTYDDVDEADLFCEVYVGRACVDADDEVSNFVMKTLAYEVEDDP